MYLERQKIFLIFIAHCLHATILGNYIFAGENNQEQVEEEHRWVFKPDLRDVIWTGKQFLIAGTNYGIFFSGDNGIDWERHVSGITLMDPPRAVTWAKTRFIALGTTGLISSHNGHKWIGISSEISYKHLPIMTPGSIAWANGRGVMVGIGAQYLYSEDERHWSRHPLGRNHLCAVTWTGSEFMAVGEDSVVATSPDGKQWTIANTGHKTWLFGVAKSKQLYVIVGDHGLILTSQDGQKWTTRKSRTPNRLLDIIWTGTWFVAVGEESTILTSKNGKTWKTRKTNIPYTLNSVAWSGNLYVTVGHYGVILTSPDAIEWTRRSLPLPNKVWLRFPKE